MLDQVRSAFIGNTVVNATITGEVADIGRRLVEGDATLGWSGSPDLSLHLALEVDERTGNPLGGHRFEVWGIDAHNQPYMALSWPTCDPSLIRRLVEIDNRNSDVVERAAKIALAAKRRQEAEQAEQRGEMVEKLAFGLKKDLGHHHGGLTKTLH